MKLNKFNSEELVCYYKSTKPVDLPNYEYNEKYVRGIWVSNVVNIDTPIMKDVDSYKEYLVKMIENIASYNINLMIFQVRPTSDAYYESKLNPWSRFITGTEGKNPGFDVLKFVIEEAKKHNIEVHAWMNPYRVSMKSVTDGTITKEEYLNNLDDLNFAKRYPEDTILDGNGKIILKPSSERVVKFVTDTIMEVIENYDVTGVHIDDYFYPYAKVPEAEELADYEASGKEKSFDDWRRENVDKLIESVHLAMKKSLSKENRTVHFGISPFAIYRTNSSIKEGGWEKGSYHSAGVTECYTDLYSDIYKWMKEGWIDYVVPQIYWPFERKDVNYHDLTKWWSEIAQETNTILYIGHGLYQMGVNEVWANPLEIDNQLRFNQQYPKVAGSIFFTYKDLVPGQNATKDAAIALMKCRFNQEKILKFEK